MLNASKLVARVLVICPIFNSTIARIATMRSVHIVTSRTKRASYGPSRDSLNESRSCAWMDELSSSSILVISGLSLFHLSSSQPFPFAKPPRRVQPSEGEVLFSPSLCLSTSAVRTQPRVIPEEQSIAGALDILQAGISSNFPSIPFRSKYGGESKRTLPAAREDYVSI